MLGLHVAANEEARASDRSYAYARGRNAYFRNHLTSKRRTYFRLAGQLSQLCRQTLHFFAYYPRTTRRRTGGAVGRRAARLDGFERCIACSRGCGNSVPPNVLNVRKRNCQLVHTAHVEARSRTYVTTYSTRRYLLHVS